VAADIGVLFRLTSCYTEGYVMVRGVEGRIKQIRKREECRSTFIWRYAGQAKDEEEEEEKE